MQTERRIVFFQQRLYFLRRCAARLPKYDRMLRRVMAYNIRSTRSVLRELHIERDLLMEAL